MFECKRWMAAGVMCGVGAAMVEAPARACDLEYSKLKLIIEFNSTAEDVGVQLSLDGEPWKTLRGTGVDDKTILNMRARNGLSEQGMTELFWESSEPPLDEVPFEEFFARWPEGTYEFEGETIEGGCIEGETTFSHVIPAGPEITAPPQGDTPPVIDPDELVIEWEPVTETHDGSTDIVIVGYQVIVEQISPKRVLSVDLPASVTSFEVPPEFFEQDDTLHIFEILAIEEGGNQTITEGNFMTEP